MTNPTDDNQKRSLGEAVQEFVDARLRGEKPDLDEFVSRYPEFEDQIRQKIQSLGKINALFDSLVQTDESDFESAPAGRDLVGERIGVFEITEMIGRGGMGVVYLARDTKLDRSVAIKSVPAALASDETARARFKREAKLLASLSHPNIAVIHDIIEQDDAAGYLVLEYVPGRTLAERIAGKSLKLKDALSIAQQVAEAVSAAHEKGVVHRDLKPGNIKITPEGRVKVLDFGLAKSSDELAEDVESAITQPGRVVGTPAYMSPEQVRGKPTDQRCDIWSFGCVLYEMLTGHLAFEGETASDIAAHVLEREPDWELLPQNTPMNISVLLRRCLNKDVHKRLRDIGDAAIEISDTLTGVTGSGTLAEMAVGRPGRAKRQPLWLLLTLMMVVAVVSIIFVVKNLTSPSSSPNGTGQLVTRSAVTLPPSQRLEIDIWASNVALAPDGTALVYVAREKGQNRLYIHNMTEEFTPKAIEGTEGGRNPFFSADGESIAFFAENMLKRVSLKSGTVADIVAVEVVSRGGAWGPDDTIYFNMSPGSGLSRVSAAGGTREIVTRPGPAPGDSRHCYPQVLPAGEAILFTIATEDNPDEWHIAVLSLKSGTWRDLGLRGSNARYVHTGHLVYAGAGGRLLGVPFDLDALAVTGSENTVVENVVTYPAAHYCISDNGTLIYAPGDAEAGKNNTLVSVDSKGSEEPLGLPPAAYGSIRLSPDGRQLAVQIGAVASDCEIYLCDMARLALTRLTFNPGWDVRPRWAPVSKRLTYSSAQRSPPQLYWASPDGTDEERLWDCDPNSLELPGSWSPDERYFAFVHITEETQFDIWVLHMEDGRKAREFLGEPYNEKKPAFHPGGDRIAYASDETGRYEVYVRRFPDGREKTIVSTDGGNDPMWDPSGKTLYYRIGDKMMAVAIEPEPTFSAGKPRELFEGRYESNEWGTSYDVTSASDGPRFIMIKLGREESAVTQLNVILNWTQELERLVLPGEG